MERMKPCSTTNETVMVNKQAFREPSIHIHTQGRGTLGLWKPEGGKGQRRAIVSEKLSKVLRKTHRPH